MIDLKELTKWENICARRAEERRAGRPGYTATAAVIESEAEYIVPKLVAEVKLLRDLATDIRKKSLTCILCGGDLLCDPDCRLGLVMRSGELLS